MLRLSILSAAWVLISASLASAGVLTPGATIVLSGSSFAEDPGLGGSGSWDSIMPFEIRNAADEVFISGNLQDSLTISNVGDQLIFTRRIRDVVATSGTARIVGFTATGFRNLELVAEYRTDSLGTITPGSASRSGGSGDEVSFDFTGAGLASGTSATSCFTKTNANGWTVGASVTLSAVETSGGSVFTTVVPDLIRPQLLPTDRILVESITTSGTSQVRIKWHSIATASYQFYSSPDLNGPWSPAGTGTAGVNPREKVISISGGFSVNPKYFFRIEDVP